ncbi:restriction endonuclease subunit S [Spirosoma fluviale]|uniref:Type I restriction enzyme, S subunit n=1 Tax=Spirosoma fluviale TaxID=1597977 RepID=A0A286F672_9BACT|nr:restriction endonuclease subunit S [Spirosoma fluviale]SOD78700.1 type I restriction enzyme, S subunit [Spirosoma fluviale]
MKTDWEQKKLKDIAEYSIGLTYSPKDVSDEGIIVLRSSNIQEGELDLSDLVRVNKPIKDKLKVREGDILMCSRNGSKRLVGKTATIPNLQEEMTFGTFMTVIRSPHNPFLSWFFISDEFRNQINGGENPMINQVTKYMLDEVEVPLPPLSEQQRIVAILDEAFAAIDKAKENAQKNLQNARELFESYLQSVFANPGEGWERVKLSDLATDITDGDHMPPPKSETGVPFITISNINKESNKIDFSDTFMVSPEYYKNLKPNRKPKKGDVLYTVTGSFGIPVIVESDVEFCFQRHIGLIRPKSQTDSKWLYYLILSPQVFKQGNDGATGTAQRTVSLSVLRNFAVPKVPLEEQQTIVAKLDSLSTETKKLEAIYQQKLTDLDELKKAILQKAFQGELSTTLAKTQGVALCD